MSTGSGGLVVLIVLGLSDTLLFLEFADAFFPLLDSTGLSFLVKEQINTTNMWVKCTSAQLQYKEVTKGDKHCAFKL